MATISVDVTQKALELCGANPRGFLFGNFGVEDEAAFLQILLARQE